MASVCARAEDPYSPIKRYVLSNGLTVLLAPTGNARTVELELKFQVGWGSETRANQGVARLTERAFLRDETREGEQTFQHRVREAGGEASSATTTSSTSFYASVPSNRGIWVLNEYATLLTNRSLTAQATDRARAELLLELGEPRPFLQSFLENLLPTSSRGPDFFQTEFRVKNPNRYDPESLRNDLQTVSLDKVRHFFKRFYQPSNAVLLVSGPFKQEATLAFIRETFENLPSEPRAIAMAPDESPRAEPYFRSRVAERDSKVSIGTKVWKITAEDEMVLKVYFEYLANRLTKKLRNAHGQAYGAEATVWVDERRFGYAIVTFQTPRQHFGDDLAYVKGLLRRETMEGDLSNESILLAREIFGHTLAHIPNDAETMARLASRLYSFQTVYKTNDTPFQIFERLTPEKFRQQLRGLFHPRKEYLTLEEPPLYFRTEAAFIYLIAVLLSIRLGRRRFLQPFEYTTLRYVRKIKYQFLVTSALAVGFVAVLWGASQIFALVAWIFIHSTIIQSTFVLSQYLQAAVGLFLLVSGALTYLCLIPRKIILTDRHLIIKSISYASKRIDLLTIRDIVVCRPHQILLHRGWVRNIVVAHWTPWRKGVLIRLETGRGYYLGFRDSAKVAEEIRALVKSRESHMLHDAA
jgi:predicted Zn-dependent peptidase